MIIVLKRIPEDTKKRDIVDYLEIVLKGKLFQKSGVIEHIQILTHENYRTKKIDFYGIVNIDSEDAANRVIKKFNRKAFNGKNIAISEYHDRSWHNDARIGSFEFNGGLKSKRKIDRRRSTLKTVQGSAVGFSSHESFHRKL
ncbi:MAG: RNA-binding protein [Methylococcales bacterium]|nr:RNA-binding protein [Methylococcales bacterium]